MMTPTRSSTAIATSALVLIGGLLVVAAQQTAPPPPPGAPQGRGAEPAPGRPGTRTRQSRAAGRRHWIVSGVVVAEGTGTPVRRARVTLTGGELRGGGRAVTNDQGQFSFTSLPAGRFTMTASKAGYVDIAYGAKRPADPARRSSSRTDRSSRRPTSRCPRGSVVTGVVIDENGEPSPGTQVRVMRFVMRTGERTLQQAGQDQTDDRGMYRIYGLQPGEYVVSASPRNMNIGDLRQTILAEIEAVMQQAQAARGGGPGGGQARRRRRSCGGRRGRGIEASTSRRSWAAAANS